MALDEAAAPAIVETHGIRVAFLAAVDQRTGAFRYAGPEEWGVAPLDVERLSDHIRELRTRVHHVIISLHWGEERFSIPSPAQIEQAHALVDAGASMILGHHPHVLQGLEHYCGTSIIYSLGNFIADDVYFSDGDAIRWNHTERTGCILLAELSDQAVVNARQVPTYDSGTLVEFDHSGFGSRRIEKARRVIAQGVTVGAYRREHLRVKAIRPVLAHLRWSALKKVRLQQLKAAFRLLLQAMRVK